jgi:hypothetical protein
MRLGLGVSIPGTSSPVQAAFSPLDLSPVLWLDASDTSTITEVGGAVSQWDDKSGNGNDLSQGTALAQPTSGTRTINSLNVIDFDGSNDRLTITGWTVSQPVTVFAVVEKDVDTNGRIFQSGIIGSILAGEQPFSYAGLGGGVFGTSGDAADNTPHIMRFTFNGASSFIHVDGTQSATGNPGTLGITDPFSVSSPTTQFWNGMIAEVIVVDGTLTAGEIADTESYLANKWGITL